MSSSSSLLSQPNNKRNTPTSESVFGPPFAYYKDKKSSLSPTLLIVGFLFVIFVVFDFLLATNIVVSVRSVDVDDTSDIAKHTFSVLSSLFGIWVSYKIMVWMIKKFKIKDSVKKNKYYQKIANEVIELENLIGGEDRED